MGGWLPLSVARCAPLHHLPLPLPAHSATGRGGSELEISVLGGETEARDSGLAGPGTLAPWSLCLCTCGSVFGPCVCGELGQTRSVCRHGFACLSEHRGLAGGRVNRRHPPPAAGDCQSTFLSLQTQPSAVNWGAHCPRAVHTSGEGHTREEGPQHTGEAENSRRHKGGPVTLSGFVTLMWVGRWVGRGCPPAHPCGSLSHGLVRCDVHLAMANRLSAEVDRLCPPPPLVQKTMCCSDVLPSELVPAALGGRLR